MGLLPSNGERNGSIRSEGHEDREPEQQQQGDGVILGGRRCRWSSKPDDVAPTRDEDRQQITSRCATTSTSPRLCETTPALALLQAVGIPEAAAPPREYQNQLPAVCAARDDRFTIVACSPKMPLRRRTTTGARTSPAGSDHRLLNAQQRERFMAMVLVTHDLGVVAGRAETTRGEYAGREGEVRRRGSSSTRRATRTPRRC